MFQVSAVPEVDFCCPLCGTKTRGLEELIFTDMEDQIFFRGKAIHFPGGRINRKVFKYLFERRGRLVAFQDVEDEFFSFSVDSHQYIVTVIRNIRAALRSTEVPISITCIRLEGYIMNVDAREAHD